VRLRLVLSALLPMSIGACSHSDVFGYTAPDVGPSTAGSDVVITYNQVNYWPTLTSDGSGVLYAFIDQTEATVRPVTQFELPPYIVAGLHIHRCMGMMPVRGGTRHWEYCDNRPNEIDSITSFPAYAMDSVGRLLYTESATPRRFAFDTARVSLWLADSATPFRRQQLVHFPLMLGDSVVNWLADLKWTGRSTFTAVAQRMVLLGHPCPPVCSPAQVDSVFYGQGVVTGTIAAGSATLAAVSGTYGATAYAIVDSGATVVFSAVNNVNLMKVPIAGGTPSVAASAVAPLGSQIVGISCLGTRCVAATGPAPGGSSQLRSISLATGAVSTVFSSGQSLSMPLLTSTGDVIAQVGPGFGRIQTYWNGATPITLRLYKGLIH